MKKTFLKSAVVVAAFPLLTTLSVHAGDDDKPPRPTREEIIQQFDTNGDGQLDQAERQAVREHMQANRPEGRRGPAEFDTDGDGKLNKAERAAADAALRERATGNERVMQRFDTDGDGNLSDAEWKKARKAMRDRMREGRRGGEGHE